MAFPVETRLRLLIAAAGVGVSIALAGAGVLAMPEGTAFGPSLSGASLTCFVLFFALNPAHLLLVVVGGHLPAWLRGASWPWLALLAAVDLLWWWLVAGITIRIGRRGPAGGGSPTSRPRFTPPSPPAPPPPGPGA